MLNVCIVVYSKCMSVFMVLSSWHSHCQRLSGSSLGRRCRGKVFWWWCLYVCLSSGMSENQNVHTSQNLLYTLPVAMARSSCDDSAIRFSGWRDFAHNGLCGAWLRECMVTVGQNRRQSRDAYDWCMQTRCQVAIDPPTKPTDLGYESSMDCCCHFFLIDCESQEWNGIADFMQALTLKRQDPVSLIFGLIVQVFLHTSRLRSEGWDRCHGQILEAEAKGWPQSCCLLANGKEFANKQQLSSTV